TPEARRERMLRDTTRRLYATLDALIELLRFRYHVGEGADQLEMHLEILGEAKSSSDVRCALAEILSAPDPITEATPKKGRPVATLTPRLAALVDMSFRTLFD